MKTHFCFLMFLVSSVSFSAEKGTISQMKGKKAIVVFDSDIPFSLGQKVFLSSADGTELGLRSETRNLLERKNSVNLLGSYSSIKPKTGDSTTTFAVSGSYGWNWNEYEFGPIVAFASEDTGGTGTSSNTFGGYFDYNLNQNVPGQEMVWGGVARLLLGSETNKTSNSKQTESLTTIEAGVQAKFFQFSQVLAIRTELVFQSKKVEDDDSSGFVLNLGLQHYY